MANKSNSHEAFPKQVKLSDGTEVTIRRMDPEDQDKILTFASRLPEEDLLFLRTDITDRQVVKQWAENLKHGNTVTLLAEVGGEIAAYASVHLEQARWTAPGGRDSYQRQPALSWTRTRQTADRGNLRTRQVARPQEAYRDDDPRPGLLRGAAFERLGFRVEAVLADYVEDRSGRVRDMLIMTHDLDGFSDQVVAHT